MRLTLIYLAFWLGTLWVLCDAGLKFYSRWLKRRPLRLRAALRNELINIRESL